MSARRFIVDCMARRGTAAWHSIVQTVMATNAYDALDVYRAFMASEGYEVGVKIMVRELYGRLPE